MSQENHDESFTERISLNLSVEASGDSRPYFKQSITFNLDPIDVAKVIEALNTSVLILQASEQISVKVASDESIAGLREHLCDTQVRSVSSQFPESEPLDQDEGDIGSNFGRASPIQSVGSRSNRYLPQIVPIYGIGSRNHSPTGSEDGYRSPDVNSPVASQHNSLQVSPVSSRLASPLNGFLRSEPPYQSFRVFKRLKELCETLRSESRTTKDKIGDFLSQTDNFDRMNAKPIFFMRYSEEFLQSLLETPEPAVQDLEIILMMAELSLQEVGIE